MKKQHNLQKLIFVISFCVLWMSSYVLQAQVTISSKQDVTCFGAKDGSATASVSGGTPPYTYKWTPYGGNGPTASGLSGGTFTVEVTDANQCKVSTSVEIKEPPEMNVTIGGSGAVVRYCNNETPPSVTLTINATGGEPPYTYNWPGGSITVNATGTHTGTATDSKGCSKSGSGSVAFIPVLCSIDPNDITGPDGYDTLHWISKDQPMPFTIRFENDPEFATAPAQRVTINQVVDPNLNIFSFRLSDFGFGDFSFQIPPNSTFYTNRLDVRDSLGIFVDVIAGIDIIKNELFWIFESIDPMTGISPTDATVGFLPINDSIRQLGEGFVSYTILPKTSVTTRDTINAMASIVFDLNEAIETNVWHNTIDAIAPTSKVVDNFTTYSDTNSLVIQFQGSDDPNGTGIKSFKLYYSKNNGPWTLHQEYPADTIATFTTTSGHFRFYSIAVDHVGNHEAPKNKPDAEITIINNLRYALEGTVNYANFNSSGVGNSKVFLKTTDGITLDSVLTDSTGQYLIGDIRTGSYLLTAQTTMPWGGVNATDALIINRASVSLVNLDALQSVVADVNATGTITAADALLALRRSLGLDPAFDAGDWYFRTDTIQIKGDSVFGQKVLGLCIGDVNRSYQPTNLRMFQSVLPEYSGHEESYTQEILYPVYVQTPIKPGAISLTMLYPEDQVSVTGIEFKGKDILFNDLGGILMIGWQQLAGEEFASGEILMQIKLNRKEQLIPGESLQMALAEPSEIADRNAEVLYGTRLRFPELVFRSELPQESAMISNYPNPCDQYTTFSYQLAERGHAEIRIYNSLGELAAVYTPGIQNPGEHTFRADVSQLAAGVYHYTLQLTTSSKDYLASGRLVVGTRKP